MKTSPLNSLLSLSRRPDAVLNARDLAGWPRAFVEECRQRELLIGAGSATHVPCPNCDEGHSVEVVTAWLDDGQSRLIATCPYTGIVRLTEADYQQWRISLAGFADLVKAGLAIDRDCEALDGNRAWSLGYAVVLNKVVRVVVADRLDNQWLRPGDNVFVPSPDGGADDDQAINTIVLTDVLEWSADTGITFNADVLASLVGTATRDTLRVDGFVPPDQLVVRGQVHRVGGLTPSESDLLSRLGADETVPIEALVARTTSAIWQKKWNPKNDKLVSSIRSMFSGLNSKLMGATPPAPVHYRVNVKNGLITRTSRN